MTMETSVAWKARSNELRQGFIDGSDVRIIMGADEGRAPAMRAAPSTGKRRVRRQNGRIGTRPRTSISAGMRQSPVDCRCGGTSWLFATGRL